MPWHRLSGSVGQVSGKVAGPGGEKSVDLAEESPLAGQPQVVIQDGMPIIHGEFPAGSEPLTVEGLLRLEQETQVQEDFKRVGLVP